MDPTLQTSPRLHENFWLLAGHSLAFFFSAPAASSFHGCRSSSARCQTLKPRIWGRNSVRSPQKSGKQPLRAWETRPPGSRRPTQNAPALCEPRPRRAAQAWTHVTLQPLAVLTCCLCVLEGLLPFLWRDLPSPAGPLPPGSTEQSSVLGTWGCESLPQLLP